MGNIGDKGILCLIGGIRTSFFLLDPLHPLVLFRKIRQKHTVAGQGSLVPDFRNFLVVKLAVNLNYEQKPQNSGFTRSCLWFCVQEARENTSRWRGCEK